jgi:hypothetical protein
MHFVQGTRHNTFFDVSGKIHQPLPEQEQLWSKAAISVSVRFGNMSGIIYVITILP